MEYQEFKEALKKELRKSFPDYEVQEFFEDGITIRVPGAMVAPIYRVKEIYEETQEVDRILMEKLIENIETAIKNVPNVDMDVLKDFDKAKSKLLLSLVPAHKVRKNAVKFGFTESIKCVVRMEIDCGTSLVSTDMCENWGVSAADVIEAAKSNRSGDNAGTIEDMLQICGKMISEKEMRMIESQLGTDPKDRQYLVRTLREQFGASAILQPGVQKQLESILGSRFMLMPCSIHELIACKYTDEIDKLKEMVTETNINVLREEDFLSNSVLVYENGEIREV